MKKQNIRTMALVICTVTYLLVGAAIFDVIESEAAEREKRMLQDLDLFFMKKYNITRHDWEVMETLVIKSAPYKAGSQWSFAGAVYFALTVIAVIGYGHSTPLTIVGKTFCMAYAIAGIPLGLVMFQSIGERLNTLVAYILKGIKSCWRCHNTEASQTELIVVIGSISFLVITAGAAGFSYFEGWTYFDSIYFCFITLSTIGFGDYVALQKPENNSAAQYWIFALVFILFGLNTFAALMNLLVLRFMTANTADEHAQALEAELIRASAVHIEGDVITKNRANGSIYMGHEPTERREEAKQIYYRTVEEVKVTFEALCMIRTGCRMEQVFAHAHATAHSIPTLSITPD